MPESFYIQDGDGWLSTRATCGPWSPDYQHAGPPSALLARALEREVGEGFRFVRMTVEIPRPVPIARLVINSRLDKPGKSVRYASADLLDESGRIVMQATGVAIREAEVELPDYQLHDDVQLPLPDECQTFEYPLDQPSKQGYDRAMDKRIAGGKFMSGKCAVWFRMTMPLVEGEATSPLQRVMAIADSGSGISMALNPLEYSFMNPEITVYLRRYPVSNWLCLDGITVPHESGIGLATTALRDEQGLIGQAMQSLLINKM